MTHHWAVLQHVAFEGPGLLTELAAASHVKLHIYRTDLGDPLPELADIHGLIVLGGPMSITEIDQHPNLAAEQHLLTHALNQDCPILAICLGAQLLAAAAGATVYQTEPGEIGTGTVRLTSDGLFDPILRDMPNPLPVFHWHTDTFTLPTGATHLAASDTYFNQAFRLGKHAYGLQFHIELDSHNLCTLRRYLPAGTNVTPAILDAAAACGRTILSRLVT